MIKLVKPCATDAGRKSLQACINDIQKSAAYGTKQVEMDSIKRRVARLVLPFQCLRTGFMIFLTSSFFSLSLVTIFGVLNTLSSRAWTISGVTSGIWAITWNQSIAMPKQVSLHYIINGDKRSRMIQKTHLSGWAKRDIGTTPFWLSTSNKSHPI